MQYIGLSELQQFAVQHDYWNTRTLLVGAAIAGLFLLWRSKSDSKLKITVPNPLSKQVSASGFLICLLRLIYCCGLSKLSMNKLCELHTRQCILVAFSQPLTQVVLEKDEVIHVL